MFVVKLDKNGIDNQEFRYFDDNGNLPDGNFSKDEIEGNWVVFDDFNLKDLKADVIFAYRSIDDTLMVKEESIRKLLKKE